MIKEFRPKKENKPRNLVNEAKELESKANDINFDSIANMLCGKPLSEKDKEEVEKFNDQYDKMEDLNSWH
ncbi:MAG: hypothetical protein K6G10_01430 [Butyrivibrio sp.]|nr:hypothetical protein [Butyrivibrio sp.]